LASFQFVYNVYHFNSLVISKVQIIIGNRTFFNKTPTHDIKICLSHTQRLTDPHDAEA